MTWDEIIDYTLLDALPVLLCIDAHGEQREAEKIINEYVDCLGYNPCKEEFSDFVKNDLPEFMNHYEYYEAYDVIDFIRSRSRSRE